jgi:hypothetical protein
MKGFLLTKRGKNGHKNVCKEETHDQETCFQKAGETSRKEACREKAGSEETGRTEKSGS